MSESIKEQDKRETFDQSVLFHEGNMYENIYFLKKVNRLLVKMKRRIKRKIMYNKNRKRKKAG